MHFSALYYGKKFVDDHLGNFLNKPCRILDVGAHDINGTLQPFFTGEGKELWKFIGVDMDAGKGVDVVVKPHVPLPFEDGSFDAIVSTSCMEHDPMFWVTFEDIARLVSPDGFIYLNVPSNGFYHAFPGDCWRLKHDAWYGLQCWIEQVNPKINLRCVEHFVGDMLGGELWRDNVSIWKRNPSVWCTDCACTPVDRNP